MAEKGTLLQALPPVSKSKLVKTSSVDGSSTTKLLTSTKKTGLLAQIKEAPTQTKLLTQIQKDPAPTKLLTQIKEAPVKTKLLSAIDADEVDTTAIVRASEPMLEQIDSVVDDAAEAFAPAAPVEVATTTVAATEVATTPASEAASGGSAMIFVIAAVLVVGIAVAAFLFMGKKKSPSLVGKAAGRAPEADQESHSGSKAKSAAAVKQAAAPKAPNGLPAKPKAPASRNGVSKPVPGAPRKPGLSAVAGNQSVAPAPNAPSQVKAPAKPKKRF